MFAHGKLLITGEYLVLKGATALALPVRFGQKLSVEKSDENIIIWQSNSPEGNWFSATFYQQSLEVFESTDHKVSDHLKKLLLAARELRNDFLIDDSGYRISIESNYPLQWGLGSSSTLIYLLAKLARLDAYSLFRKVSAGSGFDIACAGNSELLYYRLSDNKPVVNLTRPGTALRNYAYFVYLGKKQDSQMEVDSFLSKAVFTNNQTDQISELASLICNAATANELIKLVKEHEAIMAFILKRASIASMFPDFSGTVKSLGAWGGDFAMFVSAEDPKYLKDYLNKKGLGVLFSYAEMEVKNEA